MSTSSSVTEFKTFAAYFRSLQSDVYEEYIKLLGKEIEDLYQQAKDVGSTVDQDTFLPTIAELDSLEHELQDKQKQTLCDQMTDQLSRVSLILKTMWERHYTEDEITGQASTEMLTRELTSAAEIVFSHTPSKLSPCFVVCHRRLAASLSGDEEESKKYWTWVGRNVPQITRLEIVVWISFALQTLATHYDPIKEFLTSAGNASYKRKAQRDEEEERTSS